MDLGFAFILIGAALMLGNHSTLLIALTFVPLMNHLFIRHEEANLAETYAGAWRDYAAKVRRGV